MLTRSSSDCYGACPDPNLQVVFLCMHSSITSLISSIRMGSPASLLLEQGRIRDGFNAIPWTANRTNGLEDSVLNGPLVSFCRSENTSVSMFQCIHIPTYINILGVNGTTTCVFCRLYLRGEDYQACSVHISFLTHAHAPRLNHVAIG